MYSVLIVTKAYQIVFISCTLNNFYQLQEKLGSQPVRSYLQDYNTKINYNS